jgi:pentose-5-phosphate-3-epimerase
MFSVHLMLKDPKEKLEQLNNLPNVLIVYIHQEADTQGLLDQEWSFQLGLSLNPETQVEQSDFLKYPIVQLMSIIPGAQAMN